MAKPRWRNVKSAHGAQKSASLPKSGELGGEWLALGEFSLKKQLRLMRASERVKAFITDMFMINMPLLYLCTYVFLDGREDFQQNHGAILACGLLYGVILSLFFALSSQTPGYRYMGLKLVRYGRDEGSSESSSSEADSESVDSKADSAKIAESAKKREGQKVGFMRAFVRYVLWVVGTSLLFGILLGLVRRDGRCLHDIACGTQVQAVER